jgi:hypothetical protein
MNFPLEKMKSIRILRISSSRGRGFSNRRVRRSSQKVGREISKAWYHRNQTNRILRKEK